MDLQFHKYEQKPTILITGSNRSGTTWVGQVLSQAPNIRNIYEPFNPVLAKSRFDFELPRWFLHAEDWDQEALLKLIRRVLRPPLIDKKIPLGPFAMARRVGRLLLERYGPKKFTPRTLLKDPVAIFSAGWLAQQMPLQVVVLVRHPASYVLSLIRDSQHMHPFKIVFGEQPKLLNSYSSEEQALINQVIRHQADKGVGSDMVFEGSVFWRLFYSKVRTYKETFSDWLVVHYEELASDPVNEFRNLCDQLNLPFTETIQSEITQTALESSASKVDITSHVKRFQSKKNINEYLQKLSEDDLQRIASFTGEVGSFYYPDIGRVRP